MRKNMTIYDFLGLPETSHAGALQAQAESERSGGGEVDAHVIASAEGESEHDI
jgi:hypothetical protein